jgi:NADPH:quinone reductase-like Zn-dependent oxidoreductase
VTQLDALVDLVGDKVLTDTLSALLQPGGKAISTAGGIDPERLSLRQIQGSSYRGQPTTEMLEELGALVGSGEITVPIDQELDWAEAPQALEESRSGHSHGKTILRISVSD